MANAVALQPITRRLREVVFRFDGRRAPHARSVALVGAFNRWDTSVHQLTLQPDQRWTISITLAPGEYPYLFIVDGSIPHITPRSPRRSIQWQTRSHLIRSIGTRGRDRIPCNVGRINLGPSDRSRWAEGIQSHDHGGDLEVEKCQRDLRYARAGPERGLRPADPSDAAIVRERAEQNVW